MPTCTDLILHPTANQPDGRYHKQTDNWMNCGEPDLWFTSGWPQDPFLKEWNEPYWSLFTMRDGSVCVHACRPTEKEIHEGDLNGELSSEIELAYVSRHSIRHALRIARLLCNCDPEQGIFLEAGDTIGIREIKTPMPVFIDAA